MLNFMQAKRQDLARSSKEDNLLNSLTGVLLIVAHTIASMHV